MATSPEHVLEVLRTLRECGALGEVLNDEGLEADAVALLGMIDAGELDSFPPTPILNQVKI